MNASTNTFDRLKPSKLSKADILSLEERGCSAADWKAVTFVGPFDAAAFTRVRFDGPAVLVFGGDAVGRIEEVAMADCRIDTSATILRVTPSTRPR